MKITPDDTPYIYVAHFTVDVATTTPQLIEKTLAFIPEEIRPGYSCPATSLTFAYYQVDYHRVADALTTISDHNGWHWYLRPADHRIIFDVEEKNHTWLRLLTPSN